MDAGFLASLVLIGALAGIASGMLGVGGGIFANPILWSVFSSMGASPDTAFQLTCGTMLAVIALNAPTGIYGHHRNRNIDWSLVPAIVTPTLTGALCGVWLATRVNTLYLKYGFAFLQLYTAYRIFPRNTDAADAQSPQAPIRRWALNLFGFVGGLTSGALGVGGGATMVPLITLFGNVPLRKAVGLSVCTMLFTGIVGSVAYGYKGWETPGLPAGSTGFVFVPGVIAMATCGFVTAYYSAMWIHKLNLKTLKLIFAGILLVSAGKILYGLLAS